jgi:hypothetical protein
MFRIREENFYPLDEETAKEFDAKRENQQKRFVTLLPGSNAYLLNEADFDHLCEDLDVDEASSGCLLTFEQVLSQESRALLLSGLISRGYAVSAYPDRLLIMPMNRGVTDVIEQDALEILSPVSSLMLEEAQLVNLANQILEIYANRNLRAFLQEIWGKMGQIDTLVLYSVQTGEGEKIRSIEVRDKIGQLLLPDLELPYWKTQLEVVEDTPAIDLLQDLEACDDDEARLDVINEYLFSQAVFSEMGLPRPESESPFYQAATKLTSVPMEYPAIYDCSGIRQLTKQPQARTNSADVSLEAILAQGISPFYKWIREQARKAEPVVFIEGHLAANPLTCYINAELRDPVGHVHLYEEMIYTPSGAQPIPEAFQQFLWQFHDTFARKHVTARVLADWIADGMLIPYRDVEGTDGRYQAVCQALSHAIELIREGFRDPNQPTDEECLGIALAYACAWEGPRIARTCLRPCYNAFQDANYATMERILQEYFGKETFY